MTEAEEVKATIRELGNSFKPEELAALKESLNDVTADVLWECAQLAIKEYASCVEFAIYQGWWAKKAMERGDANIPEYADAVKLHGQSYACVQIAGMIMEKARGEQ